MWNADPAALERAGPWLAVGLALMWIVFLALLALHIFRMRVGYYDARRERKPMPRGLRIFLDAFIFVMVIGLAWVMYSLFALNPFPWFIRIGGVSAALALTGIVVVVREGVARMVAKPSQHQNST